MDRRTLLKAASALTVGLGTGLLPGLPRAQVRRETITLTGTAPGPGRYLYLPFTVPAGVNRIDGRTVDAGGYSTGLGLFDAAGPGYQSPGFRGVYGGELAHFTVTSASASRSFLPGPITPGEWTVVVPLFQPGAGNPTPEITVEITLTYGPPGPPAPATQTPGVVRAEAGWYRGDLHCHTPESSDAWSSATAMTPPQWGEECRRVGLDFAALTDHNVVSQNQALVDDAGPGVLLIGGEEMTNWFHGHATVTGLDPGEWLDWRQRPQGMPLFEHEARITEFLATVRELGAYAAAAHPFAPGVGLPWTFFADAALDPAALPDGIEIWTGDFQPDDEEALDFWDRLLRQGRRITANGGSDLHGVQNDLQPFIAGGPTTVLWAEELSVPAVVAALKAGRAFMTRAPNGGELYLEASGPDEQATFVGGTIYAGPGATVEVSALVRRGPLLRDHRVLDLVLLVDGEPALVTPITADEQRVVLTVPVPLGGGYVRAELRGEPVLDPGTPTGSRSDMEAFTNPIWLSTDPRPDDAGPEFAPPPSRDRDRADRHSRLLDLGGAS
ncbi:MAG: CehA/McbA family metallohydrolase [Actinobacteria bacterium]|nr:CehA/McbA family metallohydrolase [Actinomycetota bacterium]